MALVVLTSAGLATLAIAQGDGGKSLAEKAPRVASRSNSASLSAKTVAVEEPTAKAKRMIAECKAKLAKVQDYTCTFHKRERINGHLTSAQVLTFKSRLSPRSIYVKYQRPRAGREAIFVADRNANKVVAHDVGLGKFLAGTLYLDPLGTMAMEDNRHPITEAGLGNLIESVSRRWNAELRPEESHVKFHPSMQVGTRLCTMIESVHPEKSPRYLYHMVRLYIDHEQGLPIRFEAYDWPKAPGAAPELVEEYTYVDLKLNVGLSDADFDPSNSAYAFGRF